MRPYLICIDPGIHTGIACFERQRSVLLWASVTTVDASPGPFTEADLIIEIPQVYRASQSKGDPNDLIGLAVQAGQWIERARGATIRRVLPQEWKGQTPKKIHNKRVLKHLTPAEIGLLPPLAKADDMIDAIGLGLFALGRLPRY